MVTRRWEKCTPRFSTVARLRPTELEGVSAKNKNDPKLAVGNRDRARGLVALAASTSAARLAGSDRLVVTFC